MSKKICKYYVAKEYILCTHTLYMCLFQYLKISAKRKKYENYQYSHHTRQRTPQGLFKSIAYENLVEQRKIHSCLCFPSAKSTYRDWTITFCCNNFTEYVEHLNVPTAAPKEAYKHTQTYTQKVKHILCYLHIIKKQQQHFFSSSFSFPLVVIRSIVVYIYIR